MRVIAISISIFFLSVYICFAISYEKKENLLRYTSKEKYIILNMPDENNVMRKYYRDKKSLRIANEIEIIEWEKRKKSYK